MDILKSLDILLSLSVVYLIFSLGVSALNEIIAAVLSSRARWLRTGIDGLLKGSNVTTAQVYSSPFVSALANASGSGKAFEASYLRAWSLVQGVLDAATQGGAKSLATVAEIQRAVDGLPRSTIQVVLNDLLIQAQGNIDTFRNGVESWFKGFEEQVSAWYRQKTQYMLSVLALVLAVAVNLDTLTLVRTLSADNKVRNALVSEALDAAQGDSADSVLDMRPVLEARRALDNARAENRPTAELKPLEATLSESQQAVDRAAGQLVDRIGATGLPLGWSRIDLATMGPADWLSKALGIALSALALSMGAPFWFETLQKVSTVRAVGKSLLERRADALKQGEAPK